MYLIGLRLYMSDFEATVLRCDRRPMCCDGVHRSVCVRCMSCQPSALDPTADQLLIIRCLHIQGGNLGVVANLQHLMTVRHLN